MKGNRNVVLGITGSIAAYKAADLASRLVKAGYNVDTIMTPGATEFVTPLTLRTITGNPVVTDMFTLHNGMNVEHVALAQKAGILVVAPASANTLAKMAMGMADNMLTCTALATKAPVLVAPAMNTGMWENPTTVENMGRLRSRGVHVVGPASGRLACGDVGAGKMSEPEAIHDAIEAVLGMGGPFAGRHVVVTAGGTREPIDPVRAITNGSSGKMGFQLARAARNMGARVTLITTVALPAMKGVTQVPVETAIDMMEAVSNAVGSCDALVMAAAPGDYRVANPSPVKLRKSVDRLDTLRLVGNPDIIGSVNGGFVKVAFAAETTDPVASARAKLVAKGADMIVANDVTTPGAGFGSDDNAVTIITAGGSEETLPLMPKSAVAEEILVRAAALMGRNG